MIVKSVHKRHGIVTLFLFLWTGERRRQWDREKDTVYVMIKVVQYALFPISTVVW